MEKLHSYQGWIGRFHELRQSFRERFSNWRQDNPDTLIELVKKKIYDESSDRRDADYSHLYRFLIILIYTGFYEFVNFSIFWHTLYLSIYSVSIY